MQLENIKLVIWDLDDTFWNGTISEGTIEVNDFNISVVKELTSRGIINSIVSKNDFDIVKKKLQELDLWEYFVFPQVGWVPKGKLIKNLIELVKLREENILFLDDNHLNLEEAKFYNHSLNVELPEFIEKMLDNKAFEGKADLEHERLNDYKILEAKHVEQSNFSDNMEFLRQSEIWVQYVNNVISHKERVFELINRTNQLNYTKKQISIEEVETLLIERDKYESKVISVYDKYGDYGIVGFVCIDKQNQKLEHFLFSCRVINLGIEQFVYASFNFPKLDVVGDVITTLNEKDKPDWIKLNYNNNIKVENVDVKDSKKILLRGGCDLLQLNNYLSFEGFTTINEMNYNVGNLPIHREHTELLRNSVVLDEESKQNLVNEVPFIDLGVFNTKVFAQEYDVLVYSLLMDYTQELYKNKSNGILVPYGGYNNIIEGNSNELVEYYKSRKIDSINDEIIEKFKNNYEHLGQISKESFYENLEFLRKHTNKPIIFINGSEVGNENLKEIGSINRHKIMNSYLDEFIENTENTYLVDLRTIITKKEDVTDNIRHYKRNIYLKIANELIKIIKEID